jgi:hypothetical protein
MELRLSRRAVYHWIQTDGHVGVAEASDFHQGFGHQRYPRHRKTQSRTDTALEEHTRG